MRIIFVHLGRENLGIEYLSAVLKRAGHEVGLAYDPGLFGCNDNIFYVPFLERIFEDKNIIEKIINFKPNLVAFSVYTNTYQWCCGIAREIKKLLSVKIVFGGIHATLVPEKVIENDFIDFVVVGEGEYALLELLESLTSSKMNYKIKNVWYRFKDGIKRNEIRSPIVSLDSLPLPDKSLFENDVIYRDDYMILASRGCVFDCSYCGESFLNKLYKKKYFRRRSIESVIEELIIMKRRYKFGEVMFFDDIFFTDKKWLKDFLREFTREIDVPFKCMGHVSRFDREIGILLKESGCYCIDFGVQTFNRIVRREVLNRNEENFQIENVFKICDDLKIRYDVDLMFGLPEEKESDYLLAAEAFMKCKYLNRIKCYNLSYYPKAKIVDIAREKNFIGDEEIRDIEGGSTNDFFHKDLMKDKDLKICKDNFQNLLKVLPLLPCSFVEFILKHRFYRKFHFIPKLIIIFLQVFIAIIHKDYRFFVYIKKYMHYIKRCLLGVIIQNKNSTGKTLVNGKG